MTETQSLHRPSFLRRLSAPSIASLDNASLVSDVPDYDTRRPPTALRKGKRLPPLLRMISIRKLRLSTRCTASESPITGQDRPSEELGEPVFSFAELFVKGGEPSLGAKEQGRGADSMLARGGTLEKHRATAGLPPTTKPSGHELPLLASSSPALNFRRCSPPDLDVRLTTPLKGRGNTWRAESPTAEDALSLAEQLGDRDPFSLLSSGRFGRSSAFEQQRCELRPREKGAQSLFALDAACDPIGSASDTIDAMTMFSSADANTLDGDRAKTVHEHGGITRPLASFRSRRRPVPPVPEASPPTPMQRDEVVVIDRFIPSPHVEAPPARPPRSQARLQSDIASMHSLPASFSCRTEKTLVPLAPNSPVTAPASPLPTRSGAVLSRGSSLPPIAKRSGSLLRRTKPSSVRFETRPLVQCKPTGPRPRPFPFALSAGEVASNKLARSRLEPRLGPRPATSPRTPFQRTASGMTALSFLALDTVDQEAADVVWAKDEADKADRPAVSPTWSSPRVSSPHIVPPEELSHYSPRRHDRNISYSSEATYRHLSPKSAKRCSSTTPYTLTLPPSIGQDEARAEKPRRPCTPASSPRTPGSASVFGSPMSARGKMPMSSPPPPHRSKTPYPPTRTPTSPCSPTRARQPKAVSTQLDRPGGCPGSASRSFALCSGAPLQDPSFENHPFFTPCPTPRKVAVREQEDAISHDLCLSAFTVLDSPSRLPSAPGVRRPSAPVKNRTDISLIKKDAASRQSAQMSENGTGGDDKETMHTWLSQPVKRPLSHRVATFGQAPMTGTISL